MATGAERLDWIDALPTTLREAVLAEMKPLKLSAGALIYERGTPTKGLFRLIKGKARLFMLAAGGREFVVKVVHPKECFAEIASVDGGRHELFAETVTDCEFEVLSHENLQKLRTSHPELNSVLLDTVTSIARALLIFVEEIAVMSLPARVAGRLGWLAASAEARGDPVSELKIPQKELGLMVGASRQAINKVLADFQRIGVLKTSYGAVSIIDVEKLKELRAQGDNITLSK